jgi:hypothetical protein
MSDLLFTAGPIDIQAASPTDKPAKVSILAYTGGIVKIGGWGPVVFDLDGLDIGGSVRLLAEHDASLNGLIGSGSATVRNGKLYIDGALTRANETARRIIELSHDVPFEASVGVDPSEVQRLSPGEYVTVNGQRHQAPPSGLAVIRKGKLREVSVLPLASDSRTTVSIAAKRGGKDSPMPDETTTTTPTTPPVPDSMKAAWEQPGLSAPERVLARWHGASFAEPAIRAQSEKYLTAALADTLTFDQFDAEMLRAQLRDSELQRIRAERPAPNPIHGSNRGGPADELATLEGAMLIHLGKESLGEKTLGAPTMQAARDLRCTSLNDLMRCALRFDHVEHRGTSPDSLIRAAFSTHSLTTILTNTGNKILLNAYNTFPSVARLLAKKLTANDFKSHTAFKVTGAVNLEEVGPGGEIHHGTLSQQAFAYQVSTYARMLALTRQDIINDDLGAFDTIPQMIGRGAALAVEKLFWQLVLGNAGSFFAGGNNNYLSGGTSVLAATGLGLAVTLLRQQVDSQSEPIVVEPKFLVVPPELETVADQLYASTNVALVPDSTAAATVQMPDANPYAGKYRPRVTPYLSNAAVHASASTTAWYLFSDPGDVAAFGIAYLNGVEAPTIEPADLPGDVLGAAWRGYLDFGVCQIDPRGAVMSAGA